MSTKRLAAGFIIVLIIGLLTIFYVQLSSWFLYELAPSGTLRFAVNQTQPGAGLVTDRLATITGDLSSITQHTRRFAISLNGSTATLVAVPKQLFFANRLTNELARQDWRIQRYGLIIIAQRGESAVAPTTRGTAKRTFAHLINPKQPIQPLLIGSIAKNTLPYISDPLELTLNAVPARQDQPDHLVAHIMTKDTNEPFAVPPLAVAPDELSVTLKSQFLEKVTRPLQEIWNQAIIRHLQLSSGPNINTIANQQEAINLTINDTSATITAQGNPLTFIQHVKAAVTIAAAEANPERRAFRLPDATIGFELTPASPEPVFDDTDSPNCQQATWGISSDPTTATQQTLWLCVTKNQAALGPDRDHTSAAAYTPLVTPPAWSIAIGQNHLPSSFQLFTAITASGNDANATVAAILNPSAK